VTPSDPPTTQTVPEPGWTVVAPPPASLLRRLAARVVDLGVWLAVLFALDQLTPRFTAVWMVLWSVCWLLLPVWRVRTTTGKALFRMRVVRDGEGSLRLGRAFLREAFVLVSLAIPFLGVLNGLVGFNDPRNQALHDKLAATLVVRKPS
jgi:uncharacterized RDD family membrane protein YckC